MKTPDEIKKGLTTCSLPNNTTINRCILCPYRKMPNCSENMNADALAYIQQLERERDAAEERCIVADEDYADLYWETKRMEAAAPKWISVEERLPKNEETVLAVTKRSYFTRNGKREKLTVHAVFHTDGKTFSEDSKYNFDEESVDLPYDEDNDEYIVPEGWWESTYFTEEFAAVDEEVLYWMPLPEPPEEEE